MLMQATNIGRFADDLHGSLHLSRKKLCARDAGDLGEHKFKSQVIAMCHIGTSQGTPVMRSFSKLSSTRLAAATLLLGSLTLASAAQAAVEVASDPSLYSDKISALHNSYGKDTLVRTSVSIDDLENLQKTVKANASELESQKRTISEQARQIEELKRNSGSSTSSSSKEIDDLKRTVNEQERDLNTLTKQVEELKRNSGSSSSSNNSEISSLKREISDQDRAMDQLKRTVEELSRKVK
jgi:methyl-accepting chemotaxis protein